jgi:hypothetical protein
MDHPLHSNIFFFKTKFFFGVLKVLVGNHIVDEIMFWNFDLLAMDRF